MDRFVKKKRKNISKPLQRPISPDRPTNVAVGSSGFRAESDGGVKGKHNWRNPNIGADLPNMTSAIGNGGSQSSQIVTQDDASGLRTSSVGISGTASNQDFTSKWLLIPVIENDSHVDPQFSAKQMRRQAISELGTQNHREVRFGSVTVLVLC